MLTTKRYLVIHPVLFAIYPVLSALALNIHSIAPLEAVRPLIVILIGCGCLLFALRLVFKDWDRAGLLTSLCILMTLYYGYAYSLPRSINVAGIALSRHLLIVSVWIPLLGIAGSDWLWRRVRPHVVTGFLDIASAIPLLVPAYIIITFLILLNQNPLTGWTRPPHPVEDAYRLAGNERPDIYYIVVDGYARADVLQQVYHLDNSEFLRFLTERGFYVADRSYSNYIQTGLSLSASMNMEYLDYLAAAGKDSANRYPLRDLIAQSRARALLGELGYQMVSFSTGYLLTEVKDADLYLSPHARTWTELEGLVMINSMAEILIEMGALDVPTVGYSSHRERIRYVFEQLAAMPDVNGARFVFAHIVAPHPPFVFDRHGQPVEPDAAYFIGDGTHFQGAFEDYVEGYTGQLVYVNTLLEKTIDAILAKSASPPIIILQADHGPGAWLDWDSADRTCLEERTAILNAYYMPMGGASRLYNSITPVNSFRVVFDAYFGTHFGLLEDKSYYSTWSRPYDFINVDARKSAPCGAQ